MNRNLTLTEEDFSLFEPNTFGAITEKNLVGLLLQEHFAKDLKLQRDLARYVQAEAWEKDRIILDLVEFFFKGNLPTELFAVEREFDSILAATGTRGHFVHQFEVLILGWALIRMLIDHNRQQLQKTFRHKTLKKIFLIWLITAVVHDFGYPLQMAQNIIKKLSIWYKALGMSDTSGLYKSIKNKYKKTIAKDLAELKLQKWDGLDVDSILHQAIQESLNISPQKADSLLKDIELKYLQKVHGYAGVIIICGKYFQTWEAIGCKSAKTNFSMAPIKLSMAAILLHDLPDCYRSFIKKINFHINPYAFLLLLVDNLQDWHRNLRPNEKWPSYNLTEIQTKNGRLELVYILTHENWTPNMERNAADFIQKKKERLMLLPRPKPPLRFHIKAGFRTNRGKSLGEIMISL